MKVYAFIPSRMGSERFPGKPLTKILGKPMIQHVYERAKEVDLFEEVFVATDSPEIRDVVRSFGGEAILTKGQHPSGTDRIQEASSALGLLQEDLIINIQGDQPVFEPSSLKVMIETFLKDPGLHITTLMYPIRDMEMVMDPNVVKVVVDKEGFALYFSRAPIPYRRGEEVVVSFQKHLGFYGYMKAFLDIFSALPQGRLERIEKLEQLRALENGYKILVLPSPSDSLEVDLPSDIQRVEAFLLRREM